MDSDNINLSYGEMCIITSVLLIALYIYGKKPYMYFKDKGVNYIEPAIPFFGSLVNIYFQREHLIDFILRHYNFHPEDKYVGLFEMQKPLLILKDLDLIKQLAVKDFDHFVNHRHNITAEIDPLFGFGLINMQGDKWRDMRATLSPAFTGSKMRQMFDFIEECARNAGDYYNAEMIKTGKDIIEIEAKDEVSKFANDVIATSAYGIKLNSFGNNDNEFFRRAKGARTFKGIQLLKVFAFSYIPRFMMMLRVRFIDAKVTQFFREVVLNTMKYRNENNVVRNDMIQLLMEAKKGSLKHEKEIGESEESGFATVQESALGKRDVKRKWSDDELVAQAFIFFLGGFETVSNFLTFFFYEMVRNPHIQNKLQGEIDEFNLNSEGKLTYNDLQKLKYLDMCTSELLRIWSPGLVVDRVCTKNYIIPPPSPASNKPYEIKVGEAVWIPIHAIHHDPKYFPNPNTFDPERFSDENKSSFNFRAYMPFGVGPRNCIGSRFALMESKVIVFHLLSRFDFVPTNKTKIPVTLDKSSFNIIAKGGMYLGLKRRNLKKNI